MPKEPSVFYGTQPVAEYLKISRMTLSRWEKILPIPWIMQMGTKYASCVPKTVLDKWVRDLIDEHRKIGGRRGRDLYKAYMARIFPSL